MVIFVNAFNAFLMGAVAMGAVTTQAQPQFAVDLESERNTSWPDGSTVFCKDTIKTYILNSGVFFDIDEGNNEKNVSLASDVSTTSTSFSNVTGLSFSALANKDYIFEALLIYTTAATTTGIRLGVNGPAAPTAIVGDWKAYRSLTSARVREFQNYNSGTAATASLAGNNYAGMTGILRNGSTAGTFILRFASEIAGSTVTIKAGSVLRYKKV
ncbi:MAG: hypothetical protein ABIA67_03730 [Candidatus Margulisiibacteriota bacterium]